MSQPRRVRPPAVAGQFYPGTARELRAEVETLLAGADSAAVAAAAGSSAAGSPARAAPKAVIAPHAGYVYSGAIAATAFAALAPAGAALRRVLLLGPSHHVLLRGLALPGVEAMATPLGEVEVDVDGAAELERLPQVTVLAQAHAQEHSLEVELPFLQVLFPAVRVVPLVVGEAEPEEVAEALERLWGGEETAIVVSSDLSHYLPAVEAERVDAETAGQIVRLEGPLAPGRACGARPINGLLAAARRFALSPVLLDLRNSGDTAGDRSRVVGYGAFGFYAGA
jgi:AmmeMemoRadiSam system protein B